MTTQFIALALISALLFVPLAGCNAEANSPNYSGILTSSVIGTSTVLSAASTAPTTKVDSSTGVAGSSATGEDEAWKNNVGTINLGTTITYVGSGISVTGTTVRISSGGDYTVSGTLKDGQILIDSTDKVKLRLSGVNISCSTGPAIFFQQAQKAFITLTEGTTNMLSDGSSYIDEAKAALFSNDTLEIKGGGALEVTGNYRHGIASDDDLLIENGTIVIMAVSDGLHANDNVTISGGDLTIRATSDGIDSEGDILIEGGTLSITAGDDGIHADTEAVFNGGDIDVVKSFEGIESKTTMTINGGNIRIKASDDAVNTGINLIINGGYLYADCEGDGLDSNGDMTINGGITVVYSGNNGNGPVDIGDRNALFTINGGTVIATGGSMGVSVNPNSRQYSLWIGGQLGAKVLLNIKAQGGDDIATLAAIKSASLVFYSSDKLTLNTIYTVSTGGSSSGQSTDGVYSGGSYTMGTQLGMVTMAAKSASIGSTAGGVGGRGGGMGGARPGGW